MPKNEFKPGSYIIFPRCVWERNEETGLYTSREATKEDTARRLQLAKELNSLATFRD